MTLSLRRKRRTTRPKPRTGDNAGSAWRRVVGAACLPAPLALLLVTFLVTPAPAEELTSPSIDTSAARKVDVWRPKANARPATASRLKDTPGNLKWRPYRKQQTLSGTAFRPKTTVSPKLLLLAPQPAVRLIAADPTRDRLVLQPSPIDTKRNKLPLPPFGLDRPKEVPKFDLDSKQPPLFEKDDSPKTLPEKSPKSQELPELPNGAPTDKLAPDERAADKKRQFDPKAFELKDQPDAAAIRKKAAARDEAKEKEKAELYRLSRIGELSIDITPAPSQRPWELGVDDEGHLFVKPYKEKDFAAVGKDETRFNAVLVEIVDGQVKLREMLSPKKESDNKLATTPVAGRLLSFPVDKISMMTKDDRAYVNERLNKKVWTHRSGKYELDARFIRLRGWMVDLRSFDGKIVSLPLDAFVLEDQQKVLEFWGLPATRQQPQVAFTGRDWAPIDFTWTASALCHKPLYFEQVQLERYGHSLGPYLQPIASGAHFFLSVPALPYKMGVDPPNECVYALGYYRPGSCAPYLVPPLPISLRGALYQGGVVTGLAFLIP